MKTLELGLQLVMDASSDRTHTLTPQGAELKRDEWSFS
jgi:hypothetical protein